MAHKVILLAFLGLTGAAACLGTGAVLGSHLTRQAEPKELKTDVGRSSRIDRLGPGSASRQDKRAAVFPATCPTVFKLAT